MQSIVPSPVVSLAGRAIGKASILAGVLMVGMVDCGSMFVYFLDFFDDFLSCAAMLRRFMEKEALSAFGALDGPAICSRRAGMDERDLLPGITLLRCSIGFAIMVGYYL